jgi:hypothetical protein
MGLTVTEESLDARSMTEVLSLAIVGFGIDYAELIVPDSLHHFYSEVKDAARTIKTARPPRAIKYATLAISQGHKYYLPVSQTTT